MLETIYTEGTMTHPRIRAYPIQPQESAGVTLDSQSIFRYSLKSSDYPTVIIPDPIYDDHGDMIMPGHYELALSDSRDFLILLQSREARAIIPVFKVEEDATEQTRLNDKEYKKELKKEAKAREVTNRKRARVGQPPDIPYVHMKAELEYDRQGKYFLIKYEHGTTRAWGAFKG